ncbi:MAG TPA: transketolase C-terminal domain-containing protein [Opitutaceae bacterium]|nr:transketolase C-terminal domain-containing protein [Opitutaceae bacterium]
MRDRFIQTLCHLAEGDPRIMLITGDLGFGVLDEYRRRFPRQFINAGVAEQNMTLVATGMALEGRIVFTYSIGNFPTLRCLEMIRNDSAYHGANVKIVSIGGGFSYGQLGISHHATEDLAIMRALPDVTCVSPSSLGEVTDATRALVQTPGTGFLRIDKDKGPDGPAGEPFVLGRPRRLREGRDVAILTTGGILSEVMVAAGELERAGISASVYSVHSLRPVEPDRFVAAAREHRAVVTVEEHTVHGGLGGLVLETLADAGVFPRQFLRIGLDGCFSSVVGTQAYLRTAYAMDAAAITRRVRSLLQAPSC